MTRRSWVIYCIFLVQTLVISSLEITNLCSTSAPSCNCTLANNTDLTIICDPAISLTQLPTLEPSTLQAGVLRLRLRSSLTNTKGPLINLPSNICAYPNVQILDLSSNKISGSLDTTELACLAANLLQIDLSFNSIDQINQNFFQANRNLQTINLSHNNLVHMPLINGDYFVSFPSSIRLMDFSFNQIVTVDLWPLFVRTGRKMTIDMSFNQIANYTNTVPISLEQFAQTPDPRDFYLNNNRLTYLSDLLLEQYGACSTSNPVSTAYFVVGISNLLLTNNDLICDCQSYQLITYIQNGINDFPEILNGTALLTEATCSTSGAFSGLPYLSTNFEELGNCINYTLPNASDIFCSLDPNDTRITLPPPTYWPTTTTTIRYSTNSTSQSNSSSSSTALSWYIILGVVLGLMVLVGTVIGICYLCREKCLPKRFRSKLLNHTRIDGNNPNTSYEHILRDSEASMDKNLKLNGIKPRRTSMTTSMDGFEEQDRGADHRSANTGHQPAQETQTNFPAIRSKAPTGRPFSTRGSQQNDTHSAVPRERKFSLPASTDVGTNTINVVKGIPIGSVPPKIPPVLPTTDNTTVPDSNPPESIITSIPLAPSKRAKILPPVKNGIYDVSSNDQLLNTSAGALVTSQRQRRRSTLWVRKPNQNIISPLPPRPQSEVTQKTNFDYDGSFDEDLPTIPTIESLTDKPSKHLRTVPLLNISVIPAWIDESHDQT